MEAAFWWTSGILVSGTISPSFFRVFYQSVILRLEWVPLCRSCMSRRWGSHKVASCPQPCSALRLKSKAVLKGTVCSLFVDYFALCVSGKTLNRVERAMQLCFNSVQEWGSENGFRFSTSKTVCIPFHQQYVFFPPDPNILLGKTPIKVVKEAKFLGLIFDTKLTFKNQSSCQIIWRIRVKNSTSRHLCSTHPRKVQN